MRGSYKTRKDTIKPQRRDGRGKWEISYRIPGYRNIFHESFEAEEDANLRAAQINHDKAQGTLRPPQKFSAPSFMTLREYFPIYVRDYAAAKWSDAYYSSVTRMFREYIEPASIAGLLLKDIRPSDLDRYYQELLRTPAVVQAGRKDTGKTVGYCAIEKIHRILSGAFSQAVRWEYIPRNPAENATPPKKDSKPRDVWTPEEASTALAACHDETLRCCLLLGIGCSMRISEILGLQWDSVDLDSETPTIRIGQQLCRGEMTAIEKTCARERNKVNFIFPVQKKANPCKTVLVLKLPKSKAGIRQLYLPKTVADALRELKSNQDAVKEKYTAMYSDFNMVFAWPNGYPIEARVINDRFHQLIQDACVPKVVFHSLRHLSASMKLQFSGGDIKAVQGDTGHSQAKMVTDLYSHTFDANRRRIAEKMEENFFRHAGEPENENIGEAIAMLKANPDMADLIIRLKKAI